MTSYHSNFLPEKLSSCVQLIGPLKDTQMPLLDKAARIIAVDGGVDDLPPQLMSQRPDILVVGDGDSTHFDSNSFTHKLSPSKDFSDFQFALNLALQEKKDIYLKGFSGGRMDHQLAILGDCFFALSKQKGRPSIIHLFLGEDRCFIVPSGHFHFFHHGAMTLLLSRPSTPTLKGSIEYHLDGQTTLQALSSHGISNRAYGDFQLELHDSQALIMLGP